MLLRSLVLVAFVSSSAFADPPTTSGVCQANAKVAGVGDDQQPAKIAGCPDPMELERGNGFGRGPYPAISGALPPWDLPGALAYACAYACAPAGAKAALFGWSAYEDSRPLRNDNAAYVISNPAAKRWTVVVMWRHAFNKWWNIGGGFHDPKTPIRTFDHAPTAAELDAMLEANGWDFSAARDGFKLVGGKLVDAAWPSTPPKHFP